LSDWPRYWVIDFGYVHPFVWQAWAVGPDGELFRCREIYMTHRLVQDHAKVIRQITATEPLPEKVICDHDYNPVPPKKVKVHRQLTIQLGWSWDFFWGSVAGSINTLLVIGIGRLFGWW
jgi:hypothetical protein